MACKPNFNKTSFVKHADKKSIAILQYVIIYIFVANLVNI